MNACPPGSVVQCDTDGFMIELPAHGLQDAVPLAGPVPPGEVATDGTASLFAIPTSAGPVAIKAKAFYTSALILGPQQVLADNSRRIAGVPKSFTSADGMTWQGNAWPGYAWQLARSQPGVYRRPHVTIPLRGPYGARWLLEDGRTKPPLCEVRNGQTVIVKPYPRMLAKRQSEILSRYAS